MATAERIAAITRAQSVEELQQAMDGYYAEAVAQYPPLEWNHPLKTCLEQHVFTHALADLGSDAKQAKDTYPEAYKVLEAAATRHSELGGHVPTDLRKRQP